MLCQGLRTVSMGLQGSTGVVMACLLVQVAVSKQSAYLCVYVSEAKASISDGLYFTLRLLQGKPKPLTSVFLLGYGSQKFTIEPVLRNITSSRADSIQRQQRGKLERYIENNFPLSFEVSQMRCGSQPSWKAQQLAEL